LTDPAIPAGSVLLSDQVAGLLATALTPAGATLGPFRIHQVVCQPGRRLTVAYEADLTLPDGTTARRLMVARAGGPFPAEVTVLSDDADRVGVWLYPADPYLPGLAGLFDEAHRSSLLGQVGILEPMILFEARSYRPGRRAVVEIATAGHRLFVKALQPRRVTEIGDLHRLLAARLRIPRILGWSQEDGLLVLEGLGGETLGSLLNETDAVLPDGRSVLGLLDLLPPLPRAATSPVVRAPDHAHLLGLLLPDQAARLDSILMAVAEAPREELVPVHGDLHAGQILVEQGAVTGMIDIDAAGMGSRADDLAGLLAHLDASGAPENYLMSLFEEFCGVVNPAHLRLRIGAALLGFAGSPFVAQQPNWPQETLRRLERAEAWVRDAA